MNSTNRTKIAQYLIDIGFNIDTNSLTSQDDRALTNIYKRVTVLQDAYESLGEEMGRVFEGATINDFSRAWTTAFTELQEHGQRLAVTFTDVSRTASEAMIEFSAAFGDFLQQTGSFQMTNQSVKDTLLASAQIEGLNPAQVIREQRRLRKSTAGNNVQPFVEDITTEALERQNWLYSNNIAELGDDVSKSRLKAGIQQTLKSVNDAAAQELANNMANIDNYIERIRSQYDSAGNMIASTVTIALDEYRKLNLQIDYTTAHLRDAVTTEGMNIDEADSWIGIRGAQTITTNVKGIEKAIIDTTSKIEALRTRATDAGNAEAEAINHQLESLEHRRDTLEDLLRDTGRAPYNITGSDEEVRMNQRAADSMEEYIRRLRTAGEQQQELNNARAEQRRIDTEINNGFREYQQNQRQLIQSEQQLDEATRNGDSGEIQRINTIITGLRNRRDELRSTQEIQEQINTSDLDRTYELAQEQRSTKAQENILSLTKQIYAEKEKSIGASETEKVKHQDIINILGDRIRIEEEIQRLSGIQPSGQASVRAELENQLELNLTIKETQNELKEIASLYKQLESAQKKMDSSQEGSTEWKYYKELKKQIEGVIQTKKDELELSLKTSNYKDLETASLKELNALEEQHKKIVQEQSAIQATRQDNAAIDNAIKKMRELIETQKELTSLKRNRAQNSDIIDATNRIQQLENELKGLTDVTLSTGEAVGKTTRYTEAYSKAQQELQVYNARSIYQGEQHIGVLNTIGAKFKQAAQDVARYTLAQFGLQEAIQKTVGTIQQLDQSMTEVRLVTGESGEQARQTMNNYAELAKELGSTTAEVAAGETILLA